MELRCHTLYNALWVSNEFTLLVCGNFEACLIFRSLNKIVICNRKTPFANGPADAPDAILKRINDSKVQLDSGNWTSVSNDAKVF